MLNVKLWIVKDVSSLHGDSTLYSTITMQGYDSLHITSDKHLIVVWQSLITVMRDKQ